MVEKYQLFIDGAWRDGSGGETLPAINPFNQDVWASIPVATEADVEAAVAAARRPMRRAGGAALDWSARP
jgi:aldehyde dehydrogenase (NAD+)